MIISLFACNRTFYVEDTKFFHEQYLHIESFSTWDINNIELKFLNDGFSVNFQHKDLGDGFATYIVLTPEMIEHVRENGKGILKKRHIKQLKNTL